MRKILLSILCVSLLLISCGVTREEGETNQVEYYNDTYLTFNLRKIPKELNLREWHDSSEKIIVNNVYEGLVRENETGVELAMAKSYTVSGDYKRFTFKLRDSKWSDGSKVTAYDFSESIMNRKYEGGFNLIELVGIDEINTIDDKTIEFKLKRPNTSFLNYLAEPIFMPEKLYDDQPAYNGPFYVSHSDNDTIRLLKNEAYWNAEHVYLQILEGKQMYYDEAIRAYKDHRLDLVLDIPMLDIKRLIVEEDRLRVFPQTSVFCLLFNEEAFLEDDFVVESDRLKRHLFEAVDRKAIVGNFSRVTTKPEIVAVPKNILEGTDQSEFWSFIDNYETQSSSSFVTEKERKISDKMIEITIRGNANDDYEISRLIRDMWKINLDVDTNVLVLDDKKYLDALEKGEFQVIAVEITGQAMDPLSYLNIYHSESNYNFGAYNNPVYDANVEAAFSSGEKIRNIYIKKSLVELTDSNHILAVCGFDYALILGIEYKGLYRTKMGKIYFDNIDRNRKE